MTLGSQIVTELARRNMTGMYFNYADYQRLRAITTPEELAHFLEEYRYKSPPLLESAEDAVDFLVAADQKCSTTLTAYFLLEFANSLLMLVSI